MMTLDYITPWDPLLLYIMEVINCIKIGKTHIILEVFEYMYVPKSHKHAILHWCLEVLEYCKLQ